MIPCDDGFNRYSIGRKMVLDRADSPRGARASIDTVLDGSNQELPGLLLSLLLPSVWVSCGIGV